MEPSNAHFNHPYDPYTIQLQFMESLYQCIENGQIGIFESPTGTGKSLSLICGSLTWLRDHGHQRLNETITSEFKEADDPPWMIEAASKERRKELLESRQELESHLEAIRAKEKRAMLSQSSRGNPKKRQRIAYDEDNSNANDEDEFMLADYDSDDEVKRGNGSGGIQEGLSASTALLLGKLQGRPSSSAEEKPPIETRIFYCSRTHSQLSQFVSELRRVKLPSGMDYERSDEDDHPGVFEPVKHISLGSRNNLCVNGKVVALKTTTLINEKCRELQKAGLSAEQKCKYLPAKDEAARWIGFRDYALAKIRDIEDLAGLGRRLEVCPYYASRSTVPSSEIVTLPYPLLLQKSARETLKLILKGQVIIIDEAHNLMDAISSANSALVSLSQLDRATEQLTSYVQAFKNRLKGKNRVYVTQILRLLHSVGKATRGKLQLRNGAEMIIANTELMAGKGVDQINSHKLSVYLQESRLALKVEGFARHRQEKEDPNHNEKKRMRWDDLTAAQAFLLCLMNPSAEGIIYLSCQDSQYVLRYTLLDPKTHFRDIVEDARAVILAGGTMSPMSDYAQYLFPYVPPNRLAMYSFGHVIPPDNLKVLSLAYGSLKRELEFTFEKRKSTHMIEDVGASLLDLASEIPDGMVVFFPSYEYLRLVMDRWRQPMGTNESIFDRISQVKPTFWESKDTASTGEIFEDYARSIANGKGAILLSVVGGKLSEGINFSDKLGRAVVVIGLPFPNIQSIEWKAKIEHVENAQRENLLAGNGLPTAEREAQTKEAGREFYENACMRAVNQCIGRAIRHRNDFATIILMDRRYKTPRIHSKLPAWIRQSMTNEQERDRPFVQVKEELRRFFADKQ